MRPAAKKYCFRLQTDFETGEFDNLSFAPKTSEEKQDTVRCLYLLLPR